MYKSAALCQQIVSLPPLVPHTWQTKISALGEFGSNSLLNPFAPGAFDLSGIPFMSL